MPWFSDNLWNAGLLLSGFKKKNLGLDLDHPPGAMLNVAEGELFPSWAPGLLEPATLCAGRYKDRGNAASLPDSLIAT